MVNHSHKISCLVPPERIFERKHPYQLLGVGLIGLGTVSLWPLQTILIRNIENTWGHVTRGNFFLQLATQRRFKLPFTREIASCNTSSLQNNPTAGHTTTCICLQFYRSLKYLFHPNLRCKLQEKIASCDSAFDIIIIVFFVNFFLIYGEPL